MRLYPPHGSPCLLLKKLPTPPQQWSLPILWLHCYMCLLPWLRPHGVLQNPHIFILFNQLSLCFLDCKLGLSWKQPFFWGCSWLTYPVLQIRKMLCLFLILVSYTVVKTLLLWSNTTILPNFTECKICIISYLNISEIRIDLNNQWHHLTSVNQEVFLI